MMTRPDQKPFLHVVPNTDEAQRGEEGVPTTSAIDAGRNGKDPPEPPVQSSRKLDAKRVNESLKHFSSLCNTLAAAIVGSAVIIPFVRSPSAILDEYGIQWCAIGFLLHVFPYVLNFLVMQSEE